jgi:4-hydroxysphinganine ceramide fatty acyl 2-hydroxylase
MLFVFFGVICWTLAEYLLHRFLFHGEEYWLPNNPKVLAHHFLIHGIHHAFPMDRHRLVFPVLPGYLIMYGIILTPIRNFMDSEYQGATIAGIIGGYVIYDLIHYFLHHSSPKKGYFKSLKTYHMQHHYKNGSQGFGVSSKFWDYVFLTQIEN